MNTQKNIKPFDKSRGEEDTFDVIGQFHVFS